MPDLVPLELAAAASAVYERTGSQKATGELLGLPRRTVCDIINGYGRWGKIATDASFTALRQEQKRIFQAAIPSILGQALERIEEKIVDCSAPQATYVFGVLSDKLALLNGESTANIAVRDTREVLNLDDLARSLSQELVKRRK